MCRTQCVVALATLYLGLVHSWDIAVSVGDKLEMYTDGIKTDTVHLRFYNLTAITYDEVHNMMLFVDKQRENDAICGYNFYSKKTRCFVKRYGSNIHDLAFDPATNLLYFTDKKDKSINWISLRDPGSMNNVYGNILIKMTDRTPSDIQVDSCNGDIYWTNTKQQRPGYYMERAQLSGTKRYVVDRIVPVNSFAIDIQTQKNYFFTGLAYNILHKVDLRANNIMNKKKLIFYSKSGPAQDLTVSKDYLYWMESSVNDKTVWQMLKNASISSFKPKLMCRFDTGHTLSIAANYRIKDQIYGVRNCDGLVRLITFLEWITARTMTSELDTTENLDWSTESTETETEQTSDWTADLDWSTGSTLSETEQTSDWTADLDWSTGSTLSETEQTSDWTADLDRSTGSTLSETEQTYWTADLDWSTGSTLSETEQTYWTADLDWSTGSTLSETEQTYWAADRDWPTGSTLSETEQTYWAADRDWPTGSTLSETEQTYWTADLDWSTGSTLSETEQTSDWTADLDWSTGTAHASETEVRSKCTCNSGFFGNWHKVHACHGYCLNNGNCSLNMKSEPVCHCKGDYIGDRCEVSGCLNYCFQGSCSINDEGHPKCRCNAGYSGARCEVYACHGYCLNSGTCSLNQKNEPVCQCVKDYEGTRCEAVKKYAFFSRSYYTPQIDSPNKNLTLADLVSYWHKPIAKVSVVVEV